MNPELLRLLMQIYGQRGGQLGTPPFVPGTAGPMSPMPGIYSGPAGMPPLGTPSTFPGPGGPPTPAPGVPPQPQGLMSNLLNILKASAPLAGQLIANAKGPYVGKGYTEAANKSYEREQQAGQVRRQAEQDIEAKRQREIENKREQQRVEQERQRIENERLQREGQIAKDTQAQQDRKVGDARALLKFAVETGQDVTSPDFARLRTTAGFGNIPLKKVKEQLYVVSRKTAHVIPYREGVYEDRGKFTTPVAEDVAKANQRIEEARIGREAEAAKPATAKNLQQIGTIPDSNEPVFAGDDRIPVRLVPTKGAVPLTSGERYINNAANTVTISQTGIAARQEDRQEYETTKVARQQQLAFKKAGPTLDSISELSERINVNQGIMASAVGAVEKAKAKVNLSDDVAEYEAVVSTFTPLLARGLAGHTGVLTQLDVDSARAILPKTTDSKVVRDRKIARIRKIMSETQAEIQQLYNDPSQAVDEYDYDPDTGKLVKRPQRPK